MKHYISHRQFHLLLKNFYHWKKNCTMYVFGKNQAKQFSLLSRIFNLKNITLRYRKMYTYWLTKHFSPSPRAPMLLAAKSRRYILSSPLTLPQFAFSYIYLTGIQSLQDPTVLTIMCLCGSDLMPNPSLPSTRSI